MQKRLILPAVLLLVPLVAAQEKVAQDATAKTTAQKEYDALVAKQKAAMDAYQAARAKVTKSKEYQDARADRDRQAMRELMQSVKRPNANDFADAFLGAAKKYEGKPGEAAFLGWVATNTRNQDTVSDCVDRLLEHHLDSDALLQVAKIATRLKRTLGEEGYNEFLSICINKSKNKLTQAYGLYARALPVTSYRPPRPIRRARAGAGRGGRRAAGRRRVPKPPTPEQIAAAEADIAKIQELVPDSLIALKANGSKFKRERLQIGMVAPDIVGEDIDGIQFKLSDYRGKVVVIDFWGDW